MATNDKKTRAGTILSIANQKGGVGKSTTTHALGIGLKQKGYKVLLIDMDAQGNLSYTMQADTSKPTMLEVLIGKVKAVDAIQPLKDADLITYSPNLTSAEMLLPSVGREYKLKEALEPLKGLYDFIIIDTPPALSVLTINALTASHEVLITAQADAYSISAIMQVLGTIDIVKSYTNKQLKVAGILLTRYSTRSIINKDMYEHIKGITKSKGIPLLETFIRENIAIKEAQAMQLSIYDYAPTSNGAKDYQALVNEYLKRRNK